MCENYWEKPGRSQVDRVDQKILIAQGLYFGGLKWGYFSGYLQVAMFAVFTGSFPGFQPKVNTTFCRNNTHKTGVINDPLGQTHSLASSDNCFLLFCFARFEKWGRTDGHVRK